MPQPARCACPAGVAPAAAAVAQRAAPQGAHTAARLWPCHPAGVLLSGGLDSSLVAAIAARKITRDGNSQWGK